MIGQKFYKENFNQETYMACAKWCNETQEGIIVDKGEYYECISIEPSLEDLKEQVLSTLGEEFVKRRDAIRWIEISSGTYGFDCATEDMTNFFSALKGFDFDETLESTFYKVWLTETSKGLIQLTKADFAIIYNAVRTSQLNDYAWYETTKEQILNAQSKEDLPALK